MTKEKDTKSYKMAPGSYVANDPDGEVAFEVPSSGVLSTADPRVQMVAEQVFGAELVKEVPAASKSQEA